LDVAEFDQVAEEYLELHTKNLRITGENPEYFARYKIDELRRVWSKHGWPEPSAILDFGAGIGASVPHIRHSFPSARIVAADVSQLSLAIARQRFPDLATFQLYDGEGAIAEDGVFDLALAVCVFHHIAAVEHVQLLRRLHRTLKPGGRIVIFEHNPLNPVTQHIVATCPFDKNAVLIPAAALRERVMAAGFVEPTSKYLGFFPWSLASLRRFEPLLGGLPLGAQYYVIGKA